MAAAACGLGVVAMWGARPSEMAVQMVSGGLVLTLAGALRGTAARVWRQRARRIRLAPRDARFRALVQHASDVIGIVDPRGTISFVSPSVRTMLGYPPAVLKGTSLLDLVHPDDRRVVERRLQEAAATGGPARARWRLRRRDGDWLHADGICTNLIDDGHVRGLVVTMRDVSAQCAIEAELQHQAFHDPLTGLANRSLFLDRVRHALSRRHEGGRALGVLFIDLDQFKTVNDSLGHELGDSLLKDVGLRLTAELRVFDTIARLGGDEFGVLIDDEFGGDGVTEVAARVEQALGEPFVLEGREVVATASIGVALFSPGQSAEDLLRDADLAMYLAKGRGGNQTALFEPTMHAAMVTRLELQADLRRALERGELSLAYQPVHALDGRKLVGVEALLRWSHPTRGLVPPSAFIPIAEQTGLIVPIGRWVIAQACQDARRWRDRLGDRGPHSVAVNISGRQIPEPMLFDDIRRALAEAGLPASMLVLELTESVLLTQTDQTLAVMHRLKDLGVTLALDDFGTGYSSLSYLQRLPIDVLKIDRAFVERLETDASATALTRAIVALGKTLSLRTIAEGIENPEQAELLRVLGCEQGQGYLYGAPMSAADFEAYARRVRAVQAA